MHDAPHCSVFSIVILYSVGSTHLLKLLELGPLRVQVQAAACIVDLAASRRTLDQGHERAGCYLLSDMRWNEMVETVVVQGRNK